MEARRQHQGLRTKPDLTVRTPTVVPGLDELIQGGLHHGDLVLLSGGVGVGKTTLSCQFAYNGAMFLEEPSVFATFEGDSLSLKRNMRAFGMDLDILEREAKMKIVDLEIEGQRVGTNMEVLLSSIDKIKAKRLVIDSLTALLTGAKDSFDSRFVMHLIYKTLKREGITTIMTVNREQRYETLENGMEEFVADGVFQLEYFRNRAMKWQTRFLVRKLRGTKHDRDYHYVDFSEAGVTIIP